LVPDNDAVSTRKNGGLGERHRKGEGGFTGEGLGGGEGVSIENVSIEFDA